MLRPLANLLYRRKDPTRGFLADPARLAVDVTRCTVAGAAVGGPFGALDPLGPSDHAGRAAQGYPEWRKLGLHCIIEHGRIGDISVVLRPSRAFRAYAGPFLSNGTPVALSHATTPEELAALLGEPFGRSANDWDDAVVFFYEHPAGEAQFAFGHDTGTLDSIEF